MPSDEPFSWDIATLSAKLQAREVSSLAVTDAYLDRIATHDERLGSYITVTADIARTSARKADREIAEGHWRGPFHGVPIGLKDNIYTSGIPTTAGSRVLANFRPGYDATVWTKLGAQGAVLLGKQNLNEFAYGGLIKACRNPYDPARLPGGSSAGPGVAVAAQLCAAAVGTDTSGSIRIPAAQCGCVGFKPTYGRVSRYGVIPLAYTMDHVGPMTRSVKDAALMMNVVAGADANDSTAGSETVPDFAAGLGSSLEGVRVGIIHELTDRLSDDVSRLFEAATKLLASLGAIVDVVSLPIIEFGALINATVTFVEAFDYHEPWLRERKDDYGKDIRLNLETGMMIPAVDYLRAQRGRAHLLASMLEAMRDHDVLVSPGVATAAIKSRDFERLGNKSGEIGYRDQLRFTQPFNATGQPAIVVPTGLEHDGLPASMQIVGRPFEDQAVLRVAHGYEVARGPLPPP